MREKSHKTKGKKYQKLVLQIVCVFRKARILKLVHIYKLQGSSCTFNILKHGKHPTCRFSFYMPYSSYSYHTRNSEDVMLPSPGVEAIQMIFGYQTVIKTVTNIPNV